MDIKQVIEIRRCATCHCSDDLVNWTFYINKKTQTMRRYFICKSHNKARNKVYYYKKKYNEVIQKKT